MSKRLQVLLPESELKEIQRTARKNRQTVAEWVRQALRAVRQGEAEGDPGQKLAAVRAATRHSFPTGEVEQMLSEIEAGYRGGSPR